MDESKSQSLIQFITKTMGLDQLAYSRPATATNDDTDECLVQWRKHPNLQGWMERLWRKQKYGDAANPDPITGEGYSNQT